MSWTVSNPVSVGLATKKAHYDALWDNCDFFKIQHGTDGTHGAVTATSVTPANLTASLPVFSDGSKKLVSNTMTGTGKVVMDTSPTISAPTISGHPVIEGVTPTGATGTGKLVFATSPTLVTPTLGAASGTSLTLSGLTASLPIFSDGSKNLVSKSVADTLTALGVGSAAFEAKLTASVDNVTGDDTKYEMTGAIWTEIVDVGSCFSDGTFTVPADGWYALTARWLLQDITSDHTGASIYIDIDGNQEYAWFGEIYSVSDAGMFSATVSTIKYLETGDTAFMVTWILGSAKTIYINHLHTYFSGFRLK